MKNLPDLHDGFFDGLCLSGPSSVHLFVRTVGNEPLTVALDGVAALNVSHVCAGNIIFDVVLVPPERLSAEHIKSAREIEELKPGVVQTLLSEAKHNGLSAMEINASYGAEGTILLKTAAVISGRVLK